MNALEVDIATVKPARDNPRRSLGGLDELVASIKAIGILEPVVVTKNGAGYQVVAGSRRLAAARKAGLKKLPIVVRELSEQERQEAMLIENLQRTDLTPLEEADAFAKLLELPGYSQRTIAERIGRNQSHVSKRLALRKLTPAARNRLDAGGITVEDALELTKLADHPDRLDKVAAEARGRVDWEVRQELADIELAAKIAKATAELQSTGTKIVSAAGSNSWDRQLHLPGSTVEVSTDSYLYGPHVKMTATAHAKEPCHAAAVHPRDAKVIAVCTSPKSHGKLYIQDSGSSSSNKGPLSDKEKASRKAKREHNAAIREAQAERWEFLRYGFGRRIASSLKDQALAFLIETWVNRETGVPYSSTGVSAAQLLGLTVKDRQYQGPDYRGAVAEYSAKHPREVLRIALAVGIGSIEDGIRHDVGYSGPTAWQAARQYFAWLGELGYQVSPAEKLEIAGRAPK